MEPLVFAWCVLGQVLPERHVDDGWRLGEETWIRDVGDDADDLARLRLDPRAVALAHATD